VADDFNPRFQALRKEYKYLIYRERKEAVFYRQYAWCNRERLDLQSMQEACRYFIGHHDFSAFCARGSSNTTFDRTIDLCIMVEKEPCWELNIAADGFLYNMVRIIMGTLLEVGRGKYKPEHIQYIIASRDRSEAGPTVPPQGLYLCQVDYPVDLTGH
jgi:tRNA pseudouridine38-40 synthase